MSGTGCGRGRGRAAAPKRAAPARGKHAERYMAA